MQKINFGTKSITTERPAFVMGIVNTTSDSFFENSRGGTDLALKLIEQGADILDIGAESTKPGFTPVSENAQIEKLLTVIESIRKVSNIPISIDTRSSKVLQACLEYGADVLNDVSALETDPEIVDIVAKNECGVVLMHGFGVSEEHSFNNNITNDVINYLKKRTEFAIKNGIKSENIFWDPGIGFGKTNEENVVLINSTDNISNHNFPIVMALSRKRVIGFMTGKSVEQRGTGTLAANHIAVEKGAKILRVHDVSETIDMLNVMKNLA